jgi:hypothetical protein
VIALEKMRDINQKVTRNCKLLLRTSHRSQEL